MRRDRLDADLALVDRIVSAPDLVLAEAVAGLSATGHRVETVEGEAGYRVGGRIVTAGDLIVLAYRVGLLASPARSQ